MVFISQRNSTTRLRSLITLPLPRRPSCVMLGLVVVVPRCPQWHVRSSSLIGSSGTFFAWELTFTRANMRRTAGIMRGITRSSLSYTMSQVPLAIHLSHCSGSVCSVEHLRDQLWQARELSLSSSTEGTHSSS